MTRFALPVVSLLTVFALQVVSQAADAPDPLAGVFSDSKLTVNSNSPAPDSYQGTLQLGDKQFPFTARRQGERLVGTFKSGDDSFNFSATPADGKLKLETGGTTYTLSRVVQNPLARSNNSSNSSTPPAQNSPAAAPSGTIVFKQTKVHDPLVGCDALTVLVPDGWKLDGGIVWRQNPFDPATFGGAIYDPSGPRAVVWYPRLDFNDGIRESAMRTAQIAGPQAVAMSEQQFAEGKFYMGSEVRRRVQSPQQYVQEFIIPRFRKELADATMVSSTDLPDIAKAQLANYQGMPGVEAKSSRIRVQYESKGIPIDEDFVCTLVFIPMFNSVAWAAECESYRAQRGKLDSVMPMYRTIDHSVKIDLQWYNAMMQVAQLMQDGVKQSINNARKLSDYITQTNKEITDNIRQSYETRTRAMEKSAEDFDKVIRGVETYNSPFENHPIEVPAGYNHVYTNALGEVIVTNDEFFKPSQVRNGDWREVQKTP